MLQRSSPRPARLALISIVAAVVFSALGWILVREEIATAQDYGKILAFAVAAVSAVLLGLPLRMWLAGRSAKVQVVKVLALFVAGIGLIALLQRPLRHDAVWHGLLEAGWVVWAIVLAQAWFSPVRRRRGA